MDLFLMCLTSFIFIHYVNSIAITKIASDSPWTPGKSGNVSCTYDVALSSTTILTWSFTATGANNAVDAYTNNGSGGTITYDTTKYTSEFSADGLTHTLGLLTILGSSEGKYTCDVEDTNDASTDTNAVDVLVRAYNSTPVTITYNTQTFQAHSTCQGASTTQDVPGFAPLEFTATCVKTLSYPTVDLTWMVNDLTAGVVTEHTTTPVTTTTTNQLITSTTTITVNATTLDSVFTISCVPTHPMAVNDTACVSFFAEDPGACSPNPCKNSGVCSKDGNSFKCNCTNDYSGNTCSTQVDSCDSNPCQNDGNCTDGVGTFTCDCDPCYSGSSCENKRVDYCANQPCENGGTCTDSCDGFKCDCPFGSAGTKCLTTCDHIYNLTSTNYTVELGEPIDITCNIKPPASPQTNVEIIWKNKEDKQVAGQAKLSIPRAMSTHTGQYYCYVTANNCTNREMSLINVNYDFNASEIIRETKDVKEGDDLTLNCGATGTPTPYIRWDFVKTSGNSNSSTSGTAETPVIKANATKNVNNLKLTSIKTSDNGIYTCVATLASIEEHTLKVVQVNVAEDDGGLKGWHIALIVIGCILFIVIVVVVIIVICCCCCDDCRPAICPAEQSTEIDEDDEKRPYDRNSPQKTNDYYNETSPSRKNSSPARRLPSPPEGTRGNQLPPLEKPKKKKKKKRVVTEDEED